MIVFNVLSPMYVIVVSWSIEYTTKSYVIQIKIKKKYWKLSHSCPFIRYIWLMEINIELCHMSFCFCGGVDHENFEVQVKALVLLSPVSQIYQQFVIYNMHFAHYRGIEFKPHVGHIESLGIPFFCEEYDNHTQKTYHSFRCCCGECRIQRNIIGSWIPKQDHWIGPFNSQ